MTSRRIGENHTVSPLPRFENWLTSRSADVEAMFDPVLKSVFELGKRQVESIKKAKKPAISVSSEAI
jgi:hypothetical protein